MADSLISTLDTKPWSGLRHTLIPSSSTLFCSLGSQQPFICVFLHLNHCNVEYEIEMCRTH